MVTLVQDAKTRSPLRELVIAAALGLALILFVGIAFSEWGVGLLGGLGLFVGGVLFKVAPTLLIHRRK